MKLRYSPTSPYVRKVAVTIHELGLDDKVERVMTAPWDAATDLGRTNPLGKVPALIADDGTVLYDSPVICEYLDSLVGSRLVPPGGPDRWTALRRQALADGLIDAAVSCVLEGRRPAERRSTEWVTRQRAAIARSLDALEAEAADLANDLTIGHVAIACALGYLDFRLVGDDWRMGRPKLAAWFDGFAKRPSMTTTVPKDPA